MSSKTDKRPVGIFDSGIGGLTVAAAIRERLPNESLVYFGDTAHLPYGDKSRESIRHYGEGITRFLLEKDCKAIVIACNTASSYAHKNVSKVAGKKVPVVNVIDPVVQHLKQMQDIHKVGVIGTKGTIRSRIYPKKIKKQLPQLEVASLATSLLAPMIEEGFFNNNISRTIIHSYLSKKHMQELDALILACTHYPLIKPTIAEFYKEQIRIIDSAEVVAARLEDTLKRKKLLCTTQKPQHEFYVSDFTDSFDKSTRFFFGELVHLKEARIWD